MILQEATVDWSARDYGGVLEPYVVHTGLPVCLEWPDEENLIGRSWKDSGVRKGIAQR